MHPGEPPELVLGPGQVLARALAVHELATNAIKYEQPRSSPLLSSTAPQGSKVEVLGRGYRTAFVRVFEYVANGWECTAPNPETRGMNNVVEIADQSDWNVDLGQADIR
jgi:two-component sensor histidine kinase